MKKDRHHPAEDLASPQGAAVTVLAAVIMENGRYLVGLRPGHKRHGGLWEFPGGKVEAGESLLDAARRELKEELGVQVVAVGQPIFTRHDPDSLFVIQFVEVKVVGVPEPLEHDEIRWAAPYELLDLQLAPSDRAFSQEVEKDGEAKVAPPHLADTSL
jgi:8-oxo-dGTP diphosphatase